MRFSITHRGLFEIAGKICKVMIGLNPAHLIYNVFDAGILGKKYKKFFPGFHSTDSDQFLCRCFFNRDEKLMKSFSLRVFRPLEGRAVLLGEMMLRLNEQIGKKDQGRSCTFCSS